MPNLMVKQIGPQSVSDFRKILSEPPEGWCWCVAWEVQTWDGWTDRTAGENRKLRETLWQEGHYDGYLFYLGEKTIGWCRVGPISKWPKMCNTRNVESNSDLFAFGCFGMHPNYRKSGYLGQLVPQVLTDLTNLGVSEVVAFPKTVSGEVADGTLWNGPRSVFGRAGFRVVRQTDEYYEMRKLLNG